MVVPAALASPATFQSTPPVKAATAVDRVTLDTTPFQSTPPVKAATKTSDIRIGICPFQSTPPVKAATKIHFLFLRIHTISIHAAREGGDFIQIYDRLITMISIHAAREGGDSKLYIINFQFFGFQSTPPVKAATSSSMSWISSFPFQSTPPVKAATRQTQAGGRIARAISIHAAREGGDPDNEDLLAAAKDFNPRRP